MKTFRIALFTGNYNHIRDGVSLTLNRLVKFLEDAGMDVLVFSPTVDNPALKHNGRMVDVPSVSLPGRPEYRMTVSFSKKAKMELETFDPDIIHIATPDFLGYKALKWAVKNNKIIVSSFHTHFTSYLKYYRLQFLEFFAWRYLRWFYSHAHQIYVPTPSMADNLKENGFEGDLRIWARGVDTTLFSPSRRDEEWRERQGFRPEDVVVTLVSRLVWEKNLEIFATTVKRIMEKYSHVKPLVVGAGPARQKLSEMLPEAVYTGFLTGQDLAKAYASSDIFFFPSDTESFGNVTLEAMSSGLPCIVADAVGSKSLVDHGKNGYLVPVSAPEQYVCAIADLLEDENLRKGMGEQAFLKSQNYSWNQINSTLLSYYKETLNTVHR